MSSNCSVVVADDNYEAADTLVELLGAMGYSAVAAYDGREAVGGRRGRVPAHGRCGRPPVTWRAHVSRTAG